MGQRRDIQEEVQDPEDPTNYNKVTRSVTKLEWCLEFVIKKVQQSVGCWESRARALQWLIAIYTLRSSRGSAPTKSVSFSSTQAVSLLAVSFQLRR